MRINSSVDFYEWFQISTVPCSYASVKQLLSKLYLITTDFTKSNGTGLVTVRLLNTTCNELKCIRNEYYKSLGMLSPLTRTQLRLEGSKSCPDPIPSHRLMVCRLTGSGCRFASGLGSELLAGSLATGRLASGLLSTSHGVKKELRDSSIASQMRFYINR